MSSLKNTSLKKAIVDLSKVLNSSLGGNKDCMQAIAQIEETIDSMEQKLNRLPDIDSSNTDSNEALNFAPETVGSNV